MQTTALTHRVPTEAVAHKHLGDGGGGNKDDERLEEGDGKGDDGSGWVNHGLFSTRLAFNVVLGKDYELVRLPKTSYLWVANPHPASAVHSVVVRHLMNWHQSEVPEVQAAVKSDDEGVTPDEIDAGIAEAQRIESGEDGVGDVGDVAAVGAKNWGRLLRLLQRPNVAHLQWCGDNRPWCGDNRPPLTLKRLPNLRSLKFINVYTRTDSQWAAYVSAVAACPSLETLDWHSVFDVPTHTERVNSRQDALRQLFGTVLPQLTSLTTLRLDTHIDSAELALLLAAPSGAVHRLPNLSELDLRRCDLLNPKLSRLPASIQTLSCRRVSNDLLPNALRSLTCSDADLEAVFNACPSLTSICARQTRVNEDGFRRLFARLRDNRHLRCISIETSVNFRHPSTILTLADTLRQNQTLSVFRLWEDDYDPFSSSTDPVPSLPAVKLRNTIAMANTTILELTLDTLDTDYHKYLKDVLKRNRLRAMGRAINWIRVAVALAFLKANSESRIRMSVAPLLPVITQLVDRDIGDSFWQRYQYWDEELKTTHLINLSQFIDSKFAMSNFGIRLPL